MREDGTEIPQETVFKAYRMYKNVEAALHVDVRNSPQKSGKKCLPLTDYVSGFEAERAQLKTGDRDLKRDIELIHNAILNYIPCHEGDDIDKVVWEYGIETWIIPEGGELHIPGGFQQVLDNLIRKIPQTDVYLNTEVTKITYRARSVRVDTRDGRVFPADHVIVTCSIGFLRRHHETLFHPALPSDKVQVLKTMNLGRVNKIFLEFDEPITSPTYRNIVFAWDNTDIGPDKKMWYKRIFGFDQIVTKDRTVVGWIAGDAAEYMETLTNQEIADTCVKIIKKFLKRDKDTLPRLKNILVSRWCSEPFILGTYAYQTSQLSPGQHASLARPLSGRDGRPLVLFAGEALANGCTHGARDTGLRAASALTELYTKALSSKL